MEIFNKLISRGNISLAIGFFDGVHIGHKKVISSCVNYAKDNGLKSAVLTFNEHPCVSVWNVTPQYIITRQERIDAIENLGIDYLYMINFNSSISELSPEDFLQYIYSTLCPKSIFTGFNFMFGKNKSGNVKTLSEYSKYYNYKYFEIPEQKIDNITISSTNIRNYLKNGETENANKLLGYDFGFSSIVLEGDKIGGKIGYPTANLHYPVELIELKYGVYSAKVLYNNVLYDAVLNFGNRPTVSDDEKPSIEAHILNFNENIYGKNVTIFPQKFIRNQEKFDSIYALKAQIADDIKKMRNL